MYIKPETRKRITIPDNYGGNAFIDPPRIEPSVEIEQPDTTAEAEREERRERDPLLPAIGTEELLLLGVLLILSQSNEGGDILPFLLILLFLKSEK